MFPDGPLGGELQGSPDDYQDSVPPGAATARPERLSPSSRTAIRGSCVGPIRSAPPGRRTAVCRVIGYEGDPLDLLFCAALSRSR